MTAMQNPVTPSKAGASSAVPGPIPGCTFKACKRAQVTLWLADSIRHFIEVMNAPADSDAFGEAVADLRRNLHEFDKLPDIYGRKADVESISSNAGGEA